jgi:ClpP class serine protease
MFSGLFWTGQQAVELGLADDFGSIDQVARDVVKAEELVDYSRHDNVAERLVKRFGAAMGEGCGKPCVPLLSFAKRQSQTRQAFGCSNPLALSLNPSFATSVWF